MQEAGSDLRKQELQIQLLEYVTGGQYTLPDLEQPVQSYWNFTGIIDFHFLTSFSL